VQKSSQEEKKVENIRKIELDELGRFLDLYYSSYPFFEGTPERKKKEAGRSFYMVPQFVKVRLEMSLFFFLIVLWRRKRAIILI